MTPLNSQERNRAFANFLLFFIITVAVIITVVFFSIQVPFKQNEQLRKEMASVENERLQLGVFRIKMEETMHLLDSVGRVENPILVDDKIDKQIREMAAMINDSMSVKNIYTGIITTLASLQSAKQQLRKGTDKDATVNEYKEQLANVRAELTECKRAYDQYRLQSR
ncbi:type VI secretion system TssO [Foetidibacter luteolus]|uniref:type VI secretion system TssO n=1 Tax=Foetidibacter luteolus TaxID=2608880 RepID=UPI00129B9ED8|nr:type VI secretion system TssO [Foetidibacter luteolus]